MMCSKSSSRAPGTATCRGQLEARYPPAEQTAGSGTGRTGPRESRWHCHQSSLRRRGCCRPHDHLSWTGHRKDPLRPYRTYNPRAPR